MIEKIIWKILSIIPSLRSWYFDTYSHTAKPILIQLKPLYESQNSKLRDAFMKAILNFQRIAPKFKEGLDELNKPKKKRKNAILKHQNKYVYFNFCMGIE